jgi:alanine racemase
VTPEATMLALLPVGYADGIPRHASNLGPVALGGARHRVAGRVCMDQIVIDLGRDHAGEEPVDIQEGDVAVIFGPDDDDQRIRPTAQDWADVTGTISYEIVTRVGSRVPRIYLGAGPEDVAVDPDPAGAGAGDLVAEGAAGSAAADQDGPEAHADDEPEPGAEPEPAAEPDVEQAGEDAGDGVGHA